MTPPSCPTCVGWAVGVEGGEEGLPEGGGGVGEIRAAVSGDGGEGEHHASQLHLEGRASLQQFVSEVIYFIC